MANLLGICGVCNGGLLVFSADMGSTTHADVYQSSMPYPGSRFRIVVSWPEYRSTAPDHVPPNVATFYEQGLENIKEKRWDAAGAMFRKSLDVATKRLAPRHRNLTLFNRINKLVEDNLVTPAIGDWSHEIRLDGNEAVHDEEPETEQDARATHKFVEAVLTYVYTLPHMVAANRAKRIPAANDAAA